jgi:hypothetical protein
MIMSEIIVPAEDWKEFLQKFGERHAGWLVQVETHDKVTGETVQSQIAAMQSVELDLEDAKNPRVNVVVLYDSKELKHILFKNSAAYLGKAWRGRTPDYSLKYRHDDSFAGCQSIRHARRH